MNAEQSSWVDSSAELIELPGKHQPPAINRDQFIPKKLAVSDLL